MAEKTLRDLIRPGLDGMDEEQVKIFTDELDEGLEQVIESARRKALNHDPAKRQAQLRAAYEQEIKAVRRGSNEALKIRTRYRALGLKI